MQLPLLNEFFNHVELASQARQGTQPTVRPESASFVPIRRANAIPHLAEHILLKNRGLLHRLHHTDATARPVPHTERAAKLPGPKSFAVDVKVRNLPFLGAVASLVKRDARRKYRLQRRGNQNSC